MRLSIAVQTLCVLVTTTQNIAHAWVSPAASVVGHRVAQRRSLSSMRLPAPLAVSTEDAVEETTMEATVTDSALTPEFAAALKMATTKLTASIPEAYHTSMLPLLEHFCREYMTASQTAAAAGYMEETNSPAATAARILQGIQYGLQFGTGEGKFAFDVSHAALRKGDVEAAPKTDFYDFGNDFFRPVMDMDHSIVAGQDHLQQAVEQLERGENVVFLANHQSEADPQVVSCCLEKTGFVDQAARVIYVAGHKVTTDALAIPFSMGRNLICIHSKKHIDADKESKSIKQRQNLRAMSGMLGKLKLGGCLLWVAPSGGRDRRDVETGKVPLAPFDSKTIDMFRLMGNKSKIKTHYYTLAMVSYDLCPPPDTVEAGTGEARNVRFCPVGLAVGKEVESIGGLEGRHEFCEHAYEQCQTDYENLEAAIQATFE